MVELPALITGDIHITPKNIDTFLKFGEFLISKDNYTTLIVVGDLFDSSDLIKWSTLVKVIDFFNELERHKNIILLLGNHDMIYFEDNVSTLKVFERYTTVIDKPTKVDDFMFMPYMAERDFIEHTKLNDFSGRALFMHQMIQGLVLNDGVKIESTITTKHFLSFEYVFNGHVHKPQVLGDSSFAIKPIIFNVGSPWQHSFAEAGQSKQLIKLFDGLAIIDSPISEQFVIGTIEELKSQDLRDKNVKVIVDKSENLELIAALLAQKEVKKWIFKSVDSKPKVTPEMIQTQRSLDEFMLTYAAHCELDVDTLELGFYLLGE